MTHLYLIRHAEAVGAVEKRIADEGANTGLTPLGVSQAERLRDRLAATGEIRADVLIASTFTRAQQTAQIIAPALGDPLILSDPEVSELRAGEADGLPYPEFHERYGRPDFDADPFRPIAPGGESWAAFQLRIAAALYRITHEHAGKSVVIVCHGGVIDASFLYFFGLGLSARPQVGFYTHNTSITEWVERDGKRRRPWHLARYNDDFHLREGVQWTGVSAEPRTGADAPVVPLPTEERAEE